MLSERKTQHKDEHIKVAALFVMLGLLIAAMAIGFAMEKEPVEYSYPDALGEVVE